MFSDVAPPLVPKCNDVITKYGISLTSAPTPLHHSCCSEWLSHVPLGKILIFSRTMEPKGMEKNSRYEGWQRKNTGLSLINILNPELHVRQTVSDAGRR